MAVGDGVYPNDDTDVTRVAIEEQLISWYSHEERYRPESSADVVSIVKVFGRGISGRDVDYDPPAGEELWRTKELSDVICRK